MAVEAAPRAALEMVGAQLFLHLLVGLLAHPARLDGGGEGFGVGSGRWVGEIVFVFVRRAPFAHQPSLFSWHMLLDLVIDALGRTIRDADAAGGKGRAPGGLGAVLLGELVPSGCSQHRLGG